MSADGRKRTYSALKGRLTKLQKAHDEYARLDPALRNVGKLDKHVINSERLIDDFEQFLGNWEDIPEKEETTVEQESERAEQLNDALQTMQAECRFANYMVEIRRKLESVTTAAADDQASAFSAIHHQLKLLVERQEEMLTGPYAAGLRKQGRELTKVQTEVSKFLNEFKDSLVSPTPPTVTSRATPLAPPSSQLKLENFPVPKFDGDYVAYRSWKKEMRGYFAKMPHASDNDKLVFLRKGLTEETGTRRVTEMAHAGATTAEAFAALDRLYDNTKLVLCDTISKLMACRKVDYVIDDINRLTELALGLPRLIKEFGDGSVEQMWTLLLEHFMTDRLLTEWERGRAAGATTPKVDKLVMFLEETSMRLRRTAKPEIKAQHQEHQSSSRKANTHNQQSNSSRTHGSGRTSSAPGQTFPKTERSEAKPKNRYECTVCKGNCPRLYHCSLFKGMPVADRKRAVQDSTSRICTNCLNYGHTKSECRNDTTCAKCGSKHHLLLHEDGGQSHSCAKAKPQATKAKAKVNTGVPLKMTAMVRLYKPNSSHNLVVRAMVDSGSDLTIISKRAATQLGAVLKPERLTMVGMADVERHSNHYTQVVMAHATEDAAPTIDSKAVVMDVVCRNMPNEDVTESPSLRFARHLSLSDPSFAMPGQIDLIIGAPSISEIILEGKMQSDDKKVTAIPSIFGWLVVGSCSASPMTKLADVNHVAVDNNNVTREILRFLGDEEPPPPVQAVPTEDEAYAEAHFKQHTKQTDGRYQVSLPRRLGELNLGRSRGQAVSRLRSAKTQLEKKGTYDLFQKEVLDYELRGHSEEVPPDELNVTPSYYLPMHGVAKSTSTTTKLRIVFDASAVTTSGLSLNDTLYSGPKIYPSLPDLLVRFRTYPVAITADVSKMFRAIGLDPDDRDLHRYVTFGDDGRIRDMRMTRLTFGVTTSPYLATRTLLKMAEDRREDYPRAAKVVEEQFYVDDCLTGCDTVNEAVGLRTELTELFQTGSMTLRKWRTNSDEVRATIPQELREQEVDHLLADDNNHQKALGVHWDTNQDTLHVATPALDLTQPPTKRQVTSDIARTYDILGWFTPVTLGLKIILQKLWLLQIDWDALIPDDLAGAWKQWRTTLHLIHDHPIPRLYTLKSKTILNHQLHGFADASKRAFAAVVYLRTFYTDATCSTALVMAKSKVAPLKPSTIPQLELRAATLLAETLRHVAAVLDIDDESLYAWSDSTIVLYWINSSPARHKVFVSNRIVKITSLIAACKWHHVPTAENPADVASRSCTAEKLMTFNLWWNGPPWLTQEPNAWPSKIDFGPPNNLNLELVTPKKFVGVICQEQELDMFDKFSEYRDIIRCCSLMLRFIDNCRNGRHNKKGDRFLSVADLRNTETRLWHLQQSLKYPEELRALKKDDTLQKSSPLRKLRPFIDKDGLMRVGGRLTRADLGFNVTHPAILNAKSRLTIKLVQQTHRDNMHAGSSVILNVLSNKVHIVGCKSLVKATIRNCVTCRKAAASPQQQLMGQLPACRVRPSRAFTHTGVDYAGPLVIRRGHTRRPVFEKCYVALFVCMATKAVHIELVSNASTDAFLGALQCFVARRGRPTHMYSDNGSNFIGANNQLQQLQQSGQQDDESIVNFCSSLGVQWHFSPPRAPHFGGLWEAGVKAMKSLMTKHIGAHTLTHPELANILCRVEAILNSRPLLAMDSQPEDGVEVLTPAHFLIGRSLLSLPTTSTQHHMSNRLKRYLLCDALEQEIWRRWKGEYLQSLQARHKWHSERDNLKIGDVVLVKDETLFVRTWPLGLITATHSGADGLVRAVTVRSANGRFFTRPVCKIVRLPTAAEEEEEETATMLEPTNEAEPEAPTSARGGGVCSGPRH